MAIIDEQGRLFGVVNVVDALVLVFALVVVVAGIGLVLGSEEPDEPVTLDHNDTVETRYATVEFSVPLESGAALLAANDTLRPVENGKTFGVVDVYRSFAPNGSAHVVARIGYTGKPTANGRPFYGGDVVPMSTGTYRVNATVLAVNQPDPSLETREVRATVETNVSTTVSRAVKRTETVRIGDQTVATVESVETQARGDTWTRIVLDVHLVVWERGNVLVFDGRTLRLDSPVTLVTDDAVIPGRVTDLETVA